MEADFSPAIAAAGLVASLYARRRRIRCGGIESSVAASRRAKPPARVFAGSTSRPVEFLFRSAMSEPGKDRREFRSRPFGPRVTSRANEAFIVACPVAHISSSSL